MSMIIEMDNRTALENIVGKKKNKYKLEYNTLTQSLDELDKMKEELESGELSDGYHTFNSLYEQRLILFAQLVNTYPDISWKSFRHEDGELCFGGGWFIVCIETPEGPYSYHYKDTYWDLFKCKDIKVAKHFDGHTDKDVRRLLSLKPVEIEHIVEVKPQTVNSDAELIEAFSRNYSKKNIKSLVTSYDNTRTNIIKNHLTDELKTNISNMIIKKCILSINTYMIEQKCMFAKTQILDSDIKLLLDPVLVQAYTAEKSVYINNKDIVIDWTQFLIQTVRCVIDYFRSLGYTIEINSSKDIREINDRLSDDIEYLARDKRTLIPSINILIA